MHRSSQSEQAIEFYRQLALLVRADMPLPESVAGLASTAGSRFSDVLCEVATQLESGQSLADSLRPHKRHFSDFHVHLVQAGEAAGTLPQTLHELSVLARREMSLATRLRDASIYPAVTSVFAVTLLLALMRFYMPGLSEEVRTMTEAAPPLLSSCLFALSRAVVNCWPAVVPCYLALLAGVVWILTGAPSANRCLRRALGIFPWGKELNISLDLARICGTSSALISHHTPLPDVLAVAAGLTTNPLLAGNLVAAKRKCENGVKTEDVELPGNGLANQLWTALSHLDTSEAPDELNAMRDFYVEKADAAARKLGTTWQILAIAGMSLVAGGAVLAMFMPMLQFYRQMVGIL